MRLGLVLVCLGLSGLCCWGQTKSAASPPRELRFLVRTNPAAGPLPTLEATFAAQSQPMSLEVFAKTYGASADDLAAVKAFVESSGMTLVSVDAATRLVTAHASTSVIEKALGLNVNYTAGMGFPPHGEKAVLPKALQGVIKGIFGLDDCIPRGGPQAVCAPEKGPVEKPLAQTRKPDFGTFSAARVAELYHYPKDLDGTGQTIGIMVMGGYSAGYDETVLKSYFDNLNLPMPKITAVSTGGCNNYMPEQKNTQECMLDIQFAGTAAPGADLVVYFGNENGYPESFHHALNDRVNRPTVLSCSFAGPEVLQTKLVVNLFDEIAREAALKGVTILVASGDTGSNISSDAVPDLGFINDLAMANFPTTHPGVISVGGTYMQANDSGIVSEIVWNFLSFLVGNTGSGPPMNWGATGGGVSLVYPLPFYQDKSLVSTATNHRLVFPADTVMKELDCPVEPPPYGRGVPDIAANATGYLYLLKGTAPKDLSPIWGTSTSTPMLAGLIARINQGVGRPVGFINPLLYQSKAIRRITHGSNGSYYATQEWQWNACTGLGVPDGTLLLEELKAHFAR